MINRRIDAILFDFDGTLADTSFDMINCLNILLKNHSKEKISFDIARNHISKGAGGLIDFACPKLSIKDKKIYLDEFITIYKENMFIETCLFDGITEVIEALAIKNYKWGIVTNKPSYFVNPIVKMLNFEYPPNCIVAGDTLKVKKPNPKPLIYASEIIDCNPIFCAYVGDDIRDISAANSANMFSIAAAYGFIEDKEKIIEWESDYVINSPLDLKNLII